MDGHLSLLDRTGAPFHEPELFESGAIRQPYRMEETVVGLPALVLFVECDDSLHPSIFEAFLLTARQTFSLYCDTFGRYYLFHRYRHDPLRYSAMVDSRSLAKHRNP